MKVSKWLFTLLLYLLGVSMAASLFSIAAEAAIKQTIVAISFNPGLLTVGETTTVNATSTSFLPVIFSSTTPSICTVNGNIITSLTAGVCTVVANQAGDATYSSAPQKTKSITVKKKNQTISTISFTPTKLAVGGTTTAKATATSGLPVSFSSTMPLICATDGTNGSTIKGITTGTCMVVANQSGDANYNAAPQKIRNLTINQTGNKMVWDVGVWDQGLWN